MNKLRLHALQARLEEAETRARLSSGFLDREVQIRQNENVSLKKSFQTLSRQYAEQKQKAEAVDLVDNRLEELETTNTWLENELEKKEDVAVELESLKVHSEGLDAMTRDLQKKLAELETDWQGRFSAGMAMMKVGSFNNIVLPGSSTLRRCGGGNTSSTRRTQSCPDERC